MIGDLWDGEPFEVVAFAWREVDGELRPVGHRPSTAVELVRGPVAQEPDEGDPVEVVA